MAEKELSISPTVVQNVRDVEAYVNKIEITKPEQLVEASEFVEKISILNDNIEAQRTQFTKPLNETLKNINTFFKKFSDPVKKADKMLREKMISYKEMQGDNIENKFGKIHFTTYTDFEITDFDAIPKEYLSVDEAKIKKALATEGTVIPGIKVTKGKRVSL